MATRQDISDKLVHFTKGQDDQSAYKNLLSILDARAIHGSHRLIKGSYNCVCFTEAPLNALKEGLRDPTGVCRYSHFGIILEKKWLYTQGGRPVIYQSDGEFESLPETLKWRHMRYEPSNPNVVDFTWEREWRIQTDDLRIDRSVAVAVVPNSNWMQQLIGDLNAKQTVVAYEYQQIFDSDLSELLRLDQSWHVATLF